MKTYLKFTCIYCGQHMECNPRFAGRQILCPACLHRVVIPAARGGSPASQAVSTPCTWDTLVPMPDIEIPTRYRGRTATNAVLAS
jgi:DNA-directed RNA polymerase subunit RPC12/RpoP